MKKMSIVLLSFVIILLSAVTALANYSTIYKRNGDFRRVQAKIGTRFYGEDKIKLSNEMQDDAPAEELYNICDNYDFLLTYDFRTDDAENPYPDIEKMQVEITLPQPSGGRGAKLGRYALYFDEAVYDVVFYADEEGGELYTILKDLKEEETVTFPKIPQKDGYVFTGWKARSGSRLSFVSPQPQTALNPAVYYASWCEEKDYSPLEIQLAANNIVKGKEDGRTVTVKLSDGFFDESHEDL